MRREPPCRGRNVGHRGPPVHEAIDVLPGLPVASGASIFRLEHRIAARGQELRKPVEPPFVSGARTAVRQNDCRKPLCGFARRERQISRNPCAVGRRDRYCLLLGKSAPLEAGPVDHRFIQGLRVAIEKIIAAGIGVAAGADQELASIRA